MKVTRDAIAEYGDGEQCVPPLFFVEKNDGSLSGSNFREQKVKLLDLDVGIPRGL